MKGLSLFLKELGEIPTIFAYPYGEVDEKNIALLKDYKFKVAFGQHSGVIYPGADYFALPRYPLVESYSNMARFQTVVDTPPSGDRLGADRPSG